jgi:hypothetical protein
LEFSVLLRSIAVESNELRFELCALERHSAARKIDTASPNATISPPTKVDRVRLER